MDATTLKKFKRDINDDTPKVTGYLEVTKSPYDSFKTDVIYHPLGDNKFIVTGILTRPDGAKFTCELHAPYKVGVSKGKFSENPEKNWTFLLYEAPGEQSMAYSSEDGEYEITYIPKPSHLTGKVNFFSRYKKDLIEIEYNFNIQDF